MWPADEPKQRKNKRKRKRHPRYSDTHQQSPNNSAYENYLLSAEWKQLRELVIIRAGNLCERCGMNYVYAAHHLTYERLFHESLDDLQGVCHACHEYLHGYSDYDPMVIVELCAELER